MSSVLDKFYSRPQPRTFGLEVTGWDLKATPPAVLGREMFAGADAPELRVFLNDVVHGGEHPRKTVADRADKVRVGGILRIDSAIKTDVNTYSANWLVPISNAKGHGLLLKSQARIIPSFNDLKKGFKVEILSNDPAKPVATSADMVEAIKEAFRAGQRDTLPNTQTVAYIRAMDASDPSAGAELVAVYLQRRGGDDLEADIARSIEVSKSLDRFNRRTQGAVEFPAGMLVEVARGMQIPVGKDSAAHVATNNTRFWNTTENKNADGSTNLSHRTNGFVEALIGVRNMPANEAKETAERCIVMNIAMLNAKATFSPTGRQDHAAAAAPAPAFNEHSSDEAADAKAPPELDDDFELENLPDADFQAMI